MDLDSIKKMCIKSAKQAEGKIKELFDKEKIMSTLSIVFAMIVLTLCFSGYFLWLVFSLAAFGFIVLSGLLIEFFSKFEKKDDEDEKDNPVDLDKKDF